MELDNNQKLLYNYNFNKKNNNAICLVAGAGSGKTTTIVHTIVKLVNDNHLPEHFFITTFTRSAAKDLKIKLNKYLSNEIVNKLVIGTFHEIAGCFLEKYKYTDNMLISSYDDCLYNYAELLLNESYMESHKYIFVDEYQDINDIQETIIERLFYRNKDNVEKRILVVIGDDQQNIYTFRGSNINYMLNFVLKYDGEHIFLTNNYRCPKPIVDMSNNVLITNKNKIDKTFVSAYEHCLQLENVNNKIILLPIKANQHDIDKYNAIVSKIVLKKIYYLMDCNIIGHGQKSNTLAIISRYNYTLKFLETVLTRHNIRSTYAEFMDNNISSRIILSTIHGTKGLEFDHVIFIDYIPNKCTNMEELEEERRLFYVGITRVKTELTILYNYGNPSCFLRECWHINSNIFVNLSDDYLKFELDYTFFKKSEYVQHNISQICDNLTFDEILKLDEIIPFRSFLQKNNKKCKMIKIHERIVLENIIKKNSYEQIITCYEHLYEIFGKYILINKIYKLYKCHISLDIIQSIIFKNYSLIKNTKDNNLNFLIEYVFNKYKIDLSKSDIDIGYLKRYSSYSHKICPKYLDWDHILDPNIKDKYMKSVNRYYDGSYNNVDLFNVSIISDMTINNRLSMQYLNFDDKILNLISDKYGDMDNLLDEIQLLECKVLYGEIYEYEEYVIKSDFIFLIENNSMVMGIVSNDSPNVNNIIQQLTIAFLHNNNYTSSDKYMIKKINLYIPLTGLIYQINISKIDRIFETTFLNKLINIK